VFERLELQAQATYCLEHISIIDLQERDYEAVERSIARLCEISTAWPTFYAHAVEYEIRVRLAFETRSPKPLGGFEVKSGMLAPFSKAPRARLNVEALELGKLIVLNSTSSLETCITLVQELHSRLRNRCDQDFVVAALTSALTRIDRAREGAHIVRDYLVNHRRERAFLLPSLLRAASEVGVSIPERYSVETPNVEVG